MLKRLVLVALGLGVAVLLAELGLVLAHFNAPVRYLATMGVAPERPVFGSLEAYMAAQAPQVEPHRDFLNFWTNSLGLNDLEFVVPKPAGRLRILAVGDSFTYGLVLLPGCRHDPARGGPSGGLPTGQPRTCSTSASVGWASGIQDTRRTGSRDLRP